MSDSMERGWRDQIEKTRLLRLLVAKANAALIGTGFVPYEEWMSDSLLKEIAALRARCEELERERDELYTRANAKPCKHYHTTDAVLAKQDRIADLEAKLAAAETEIARLRSVICPGAAAAHEEYAAAQDDLLDLLAAFREADETEQRETWAVLRPALERAGKLGAARKGEEKP